MSGGSDLETLRRRIDAIDDQLHDLLMERTQVVESVRDLKRDERVKIRPAREDEIVCRLMERHRGPFPKRELFRIWREIIVATLGFEGPFSVAVYTGDEAPGAWDLARDHYGSFTPTSAFGSCRQVIEAVRKQQATVGILPLPGRDQPDPWWRHLVTVSQDAPRIIARLPFAGPGNSRGGGTEALVVCPVPRGDSGRERSYLGFDADGEATQGRVREGLEAVGFDVRFLDAWSDPQVPGMGLFLAEVEGFVAADDPRVARCGDILARSVNRIIRLGGYARPLSADELA